MTGETDEKLVHRICAEIEKEFEGISATHGDLAVGRPDLQDGYNRVDVLCVPVERRDEIEDACYDIADSFEDVLSMPVVFLVWTPKETEKHFRAEFERICRGRKPKWRQMFESEWLAVDTIAYEGHEDVVAPNGLKPIKVAAEARKYRLATAVQFRVHEGASERMEALIGAWTEYGTGTAMAGTMPCHSVLERAA